VSSLHNVTLTYTDWYSRWATTTQLSPLIPVEDATSSTYTDEMKQAYNTVAFMKDAGLGLEYWKDEVGRQFGTGTLSNPTPEPEESWDAESEADEELKQALRISSQAHYGSTPHNIPTTSRSLPERGGRQSSVITIDDDEDEADNLDLYSPPSPRRRLLASPKRSRPSHPRYRFQECSIVISDDEDLPRKHPRKKSLSVDGDSKESSPQQKRVRPRFSGGTALDQLLQSSSLGQRSSAPVSDSIEVDMYVFGYSH
jgi:hypothetical protein